MRARAIVCVLRTREKKDASFFVLSSSRLGLNLPPVLSICDRARDDGEGRPRRDGRRGRRCRGNHHGDDRALPHPEGGRRRGGLGARVRSQGTRAGARADGSGFHPFHRAHHHPVQGGGQLPLHVGPVRAVVHGDGSKAGAGADLHAALRRHRGPEHHEARDEQQPQELQQGSRVFVRALPGDPRHRAGDQRRGHVEEDARAHLQGAPGGDSRRDHRHRHARGGQALRQARRHQGHRQIDRHGERVSPADPPGHRRGHPLLIPRGIRRAVPIALPANHGRVQRQVAVPVEDLPSHAGVVRAQEAGAPAGRGHHQDRPRSVGQEALGTERPGRHPGASLGPGAEREAVGG